MAILEYSPKAQSVLPTFLNKDIVVFIEGNADSKMSIDIAFWQTIFKTFCPKKAEIIQRGGKTHLLHILQESEGKNKNVFVAIDRDLEDIHKKIGKFSNLIYTYGYSYENDLYSLNLIFDILTIYAFLPRERHNNIKKNLKKEINTFLQEIAGYMCAFSKGQEIGCSVLPNEKQSHKFDRLFGKDESLNHKEIQKCIAKLPEKCCCSGTHKLFKNKRYCNGHLLETFFRKLINRYCGKKAFNNNEDLKKAAIRGFEKFLEPQVYEYYKKCLGAI